MVTPTQIRKSHQNFRILQVLQYYLKLQCHSDHIMITNNESKIIKIFLDLIYNEQIRNFEIFIDHQRKNFNKTFKTMKSLQNERNMIKNVRNLNRNTSITPPQYATINSKNEQKICTTDLISEQQFISIDGYLIINDQFLSKLAQIKVPQQWLDNQDFRQQKKQMYKMKIQQHQILKQLRDSKNQFTQSINYLVSLVGLPKLSYEQINVDSLKNIKNAKIKQVTTQLKQLMNTSKNLDIRLQKLKNRKIQFQKLQKQKNQQQSQDLKKLRGDITNIQKQINLNKNQLNALIHSHSTNQIEVNNQKSIKNSSFISTSSVKLVNSNESQIVKKSSFISNTKNGVNNTLNGNFVKKQSEQSKYINNNVNTQSSSSVMKNSSMMLSRSNGFGGLGNLQNLNIKSQQFQQYRKSSLLFAKYAPALQLLRKKKFQQSLLKQMTKCQFEAEKQYERLKMDFTKATNQLKNIMNDCD